MEGRTLVLDERGWQGCGKEEKRGWRLQVVQVAAVPQDWGQSMRAIQALRGSSQGLVLSSGRQCGSPRKEAQLLATDRIREWPDQGSGDPSQWGNHSEAACRAEPLQEARAPPAPCVSARTRYSLTATTAATARV